MTQHIRLSQFITTYGPGSILEGQFGPKIIPLADIGFFHPGNYSPQNYEISDQRMSRGLLQGARIFRLPSNSELSVSQNRYIYHTKPFPNWRLCLNAARHNGHVYVLYLGQDCPECHQMLRRRNEPVRFVMACPDGHLDDVNWSHFVHQGAACQHNRWFMWHGGGGSLSNIVIECPQCHARSMSLGTAYGIRWSCSGRFPEREQLGPGSIQRGPCSRRARLVQRQASNLRIPELRTLFSISPRYTRLHTLLETTPIYSYLSITIPQSIQEFTNALTRLTQRGMVAQNTVNEILQSPWPEIQIAINDIMTDIPTSYDELILEEFRALLEASVRGAPPRRGPQPHSPVIFEVNPNLIHRHRGPNGALFRVTPVLKLQTVTVQIGYRREIDQQLGPQQQIDPRYLADVTQVSFTDPVNPQQRWYPGTSFLGEGIFVSLDKDDGLNYKISGKAASEWATASNNSTDYPDKVFRNPRKEELQPIFVWWHTLSHLLIRSIAEESGYSSASIRERVYIENTTEGPKGGILLYATQPGSEGTLGGLIALVPHFQHTLDVAFDHLITCSGDPLCIETEFTNRKYNGAGCYGCLLVSETSCEHRNMWLDRHILLENQP